MLAGHVDEDALRAAFHAHKEGQTMFTRRMAINIADFFGVPPLSLVWKLEKMGLLKRGSWDWFKHHGGITKAQIEEVRRDRATATPQESANPSPPHAEPLPTRISAPTNTTTRPAEGGEI